MSQALDPSSMRETIDLYCAAWSTGDPVRRRALLDQVWSSGATYTDPTVHVEGADALERHIAGVQAQRPGAVIERTSDVDAHHGVARFAWHLRRADGSTLPEGIDIVDFTADGRIARIVGFFGPIRRG